MQSNYLVLVAAAALRLLSKQPLKFHSFYAKTRHGLHIEMVPLQEMLSHFPNQH